MNITRHNLALLASLSTILEERNVTQAAAKLGISQPALSAQLATLRKILDDPLLVPALPGKGMVLTPRGSYLRDPLRRSLQALEDVVNNELHFEPTNSQRVFTISANDNASAIVGPKLLEVVRGAGIQGIKFAFRSVNFKKLAEQLESGEVDVALVSKMAMPNAAHEPLLMEEFRLAHRKGHPRGKQEATLQEYAELEHVIVSSDGGGFRGSIDDILATHGLNRRVATSVQYYSLVPLLLQATDLVCTLPARFLDRFSDLLVSTALPFATPRFDLFSTWHMRFNHDPGHMWLRAQLSLCVQQ